MTIDGDSLVVYNAPIARRKLGLAGIPGSGTVVGPVVSTDNAIARYDATTGKLLQDSGATVNDAGAVLATAIDANTVSLGNTSSANAGVAFYSAGGRMALRADGQVNLYLGNSRNVFANGIPLILSSDASGTGDVSITRIAAGILGVRDASTGGGALSMIEQTAPAAPAANGCYIYAEDNGAGKTRLMAKFATGAAQQVAIEP